MSRPVSREPVFLRLIPEKYSECSGDIADPKRAYEHCTGPSMSLALGPLGARNSFIKKTRLTVMSGQRQLAHIPIGEIAQRTPKQYTDYPEPMIEGYDVLSYIVLGPRMGITWKKADENKAYRYQMRFKTDADCNSLVTCFSRSNIIKEQVKSQQQSQPSSQRPSLDISRPGTSETADLINRPYPAPTTEQSKRNPYEAVDRSFMNASGFESSTHVTAGAIESQSYGNPPQPTVTQAPRKVQYSLWPTQSTHRPGTVGGTTTTQSHGTTTDSSAEITRPSTMPLQPDHIIDFALAPAPLAPKTFRSPHTDMDALVPPRQLPFTTGKAPPVFGTHQVALPRSRPELAEPRDGSISPFKLPHTAHDIYGSSPELQQSSRPVGLWQPSWSNAGTSEMPRAFPVPPRTTSSDQSTGGRFNPPLTQSTRPGISHAAPPTQDKTLESVRAFMSLPQRMRREKLESTWETLIMSDEFLDFAMEVEMTMPEFAQG